MRMSSKGNRAGDGGFTLLEALLASAALALIAIPILTGYSQATQLATRAEAQLEQTEFAHSLIEELTVAGPLEPVTSVYAERFAYDVTVEEETIDPTNRFAKILSFHRVTITVDDLTSPAPPTELTHLVAQEQR